MPDYLKLIAERGWREGLTTRSIEGSTVAVIGTGDIGQNAAKRYKALGAQKVIGFSRSGKKRDYFDETYRIDEFDGMMAGGLSEQLDVLLLCVPGTPDSEGLLSAERISLLSKKTFVINVGRGIVIDQDALIEALNSERIAGAALDVVYPEPLPADHPLWDAKNCIITPHISGDMSLLKTVDTTVDIFCDNLRRYADGRELTNLIDINAGY
jgi:phosphoglycerate dehydrogenase-like enzyme